MKFINIWLTILKDIVKFLLKIVIEINNLSYFLPLYYVFWKLLYILYFKKNNVIKLKNYAGLTFCSTTLMKYWSAKIRTWEKILRKEMHGNCRFFNNIEEIFQEIDMFYRNHGWHVNMHMVEHYFLMVSN